jgi:hypothetical protein
MLAYAGARIWGRRHQPEALLGLLFDDEPDMIDVTPKQVGVYATRAEYDEQTRKDLNARPIEAPKPKAPPPEIKPPAPVEAKVPYELEKPDAGADATQAWRDWCAKFIALYRTSKTLQVAELWASTNYDTIALLTEQEPKMFRMLENAMTLHTAPMKPKDPAP